MYKTLIFWRLKWWGRKEVWNPMQVCNRFFVKSWSFCMQTGTRSKMSLKMQESYWMAYLLTGNLLGTFSTWLIIADIPYTYNIGGSDQPILMDKPRSSHLEAAFRILRSWSTTTLYFPLSNIVSALVIAVVVPSSECYFPFPRSSYNLSCGDRIPPLQ